MHNLSLHAGPPIGAVFFGALLFLGFLAALTFLLVFVLRGGRSKSRPGPLGSLFLSLGVLGLAGMALAVFLGSGALLVGSAALKRSPLRSIEVVRTELAEAQHAGPGVFDARFEGQGLARSGHRGEPRDSGDPFDSGVDSGVDSGDPGDGTIEGEALRRYAGQDEPALEPGLDARWPVHLLVTWRGHMESRRAERIRDWLEDATDGDVDLVATRPVPGRPDHVVLDFGLDVSRRDLRDLERDFERGQPFLELPEGVRIELAD